MKMSGNLVEEFESLGLEPNRDLAATERFVAVVEEAAEIHQQGQRSCGADVDGKGRVCQASLQESPTLVVIEQLSGLLTRNVGHEQFS